MAKRREFLRHLGLGTAGTLFLPSIDLSATPPADPHRFPRSTPEQQGISSASLRAFLASIQASGQEFHSLMIIRHGHVVAEGWWYPFAPEQHQQLYSLSKSFTGTAIGMAIDEKRLKLDDPVISFFPKE